MDISIDISLDISMYISMDIPFGISGCLLRRVDLWTNSRCLLKRVDLDFPVGVNREGYYYDVQSM